MRIDDVDHARRGEIKPLLARLGIGRAKDRVEVGRRTEVDQDEVADLRR